METDIRIRTGKSGIYNYLYITFIYNDIEYWWTRDTRISAYSLVSMMRDEIEALVQVVSDNLRMKILLPELMRVEGEL